MMMDDRDRREKEKRQGGREIKGWIEGLKVRDARERNGWEIKIKEKERKGKRKRKNGGGGGGGRRDKWYLNRFGCNFDRFEFIFAFI